VAQIVSQVEPRAVTVAELLRRCAPASGLDHEDAEPIPVSALLQREGRWTDAASRIPDRPRAPEASDEPTGRRLLVRRGAIAAGALLAASSVFGLTTAMHGTGEHPTVGGTYPGEGALDGVAAEDPSPALDGGSAAPTSWMPVAFPTALKGSTIAHQIAAAATGSASTPATATSAARAGAAGTTKGRTSTSSSSAATSAATNATHGGGSGAVAATTSTLGDTVSSVGANTPVAGVTGAVGTTVADVGRTLDKTSAPLSAVTAPLNTVTAPLTKVTAPLTSSVPTSATSAAPTAVTSTVGTVANTVTGLLGH